MGIFSYENEPKQASKRHFTKASWSIVAAALLVSALALPNLSVRQVQANHGTECISGDAPTSCSWWERSTAGGHRTELSCPTSTSMECKIPIYLVLSGSQSLTTIKGNPSSSTITSNTDNGISDLNGATTKIGILRTTTVNDIWDNKVYAAPLDSAQSGYVANTKHHCVPGPYPFCWDGDKHLIKAEVQLNSNTNAKPYASTESCAANQVANTYDIEKVMAHELYHVMGFWHSPEPVSPIYYQYMCGSSYGFSLTSHDISAIQLKYP